MGRFSAMTSTVPPTVSPASRAASTSAIIFSAAALSAQWTGDSSTASQSMASCSGGSAWMRPMEITWLCSLILNSSSRRMATAPAATRPAVSRAEARSSELRTSWKPYFIAPGRSACPGRIRVTR